MTVLVRPWEGPERRRRWLRRWWVGIWLRRAVPVDRRLSALEFRVRALADRVGVRLDEELRVIRDDQ